MLAFSGNCIRLDIIWKSTTILRQKVLPSISLMQNLHRNLNAQRCESSGQRGFAFKLPAVANTRLCTPCHPIEHLSSPAARPLSIACRSALDDELTQSSVESRRQSATIAPSIQLPQFCCGCGVKMQQTDPKAPG